VNAGRHAEALSATTADAMPRSDSPYNRVWLRIAAAVRARRDDCALCGKPIDYTLPANDPWSFSCDHITPVNAGGRATLDNAQASHLRCNIAKGDGMRRKRARITLKRLKTSRDW
jgi:5-methylcytosine-specific restriction endonuclease McrA